jgi:hypothetical protein
MIMGAAIWNPTFAAATKLKVNVKLVSQVLISINFGGGQGQSWEYEYTLQRLEGSAPTFSISALKSVPYTLKPPP